MSSTLPTGGTTGKTFDKDYLVKNTSITTLCRGIGVATGLLLDAVIMALFGLGTEVDSFFAALGVPFMISSALGTQFSQVLVPMVAKIDTESGRARTWEFLSNVITTWSGLAFLACGFGMLTASLTMPLQVPGLNGDATLLSTRINMILVWLILVRGIGDILSSVLYAFHKYWLASFSRAITNVFGLLTLLALYKKLGIYALAISFIAGALSQCVVLWWALRDLGFSFRLICRFNDPDIRTLSRLMIYPSAGQMLSEFRTVLENYFASYCAPGVLSGLKYATRIITSVSSILVSSVVTATLPMVSHNMAENNLGEMKRNILRGMKLLILLSLPLSAWLVFNGESLVSLMFVRGKFLTADAVLIGHFLALMTPYILFGRVVSLTQTPFYAGMDTKTPLIGMVLSFVSYLIFTPVLVHLLGVYGFPLSTSLTAIFAAIVMAILMHRSFGAVGWIDLRDFTSKISLAVVVSCLGFVAGRMMLIGFNSQTLAGKILALGVPSTIGLGAFCVVAQMTGLLQAADLVRRFRRMSAKGSD